MAQLISHTVLGELAELLDVSIPFNLAEQPEKQSFPVENSC